MALSIQSLVVDPNPASCVLIGDVLRALGGEVQAAASGAQAMVLFREQMPDVVLLSWRLSDGVGGLEFSRGLRAERWGDECFIAVYGVPMDGDPDTAAQAIQRRYPVDLVLPAGFSIGLLLRPLEELKRTVESGQVLSLNVDVAQSSGFDDPPRGLPELLRGRPADDEAGVGDQGSESGDPAGAGVDQSWRDLLNAPVSAESIARLLTKRIG